jgi:tRNA G18 (ribose-2'-O)-methylase SpoU
VFVDDFSKCPLTPTVSKTSAGALELIDIIKIRDKANFFLNCQ